MIICQVCGLPLKNAYGVTQHLKSKRRAKDPAHMAWEEELARANHQSLTKVCRICGVEKPKEKFGRSTSCNDGRRWQCKACVCLHVTQANPTRIWAEATKHKKASALKIRDARLRKEYGMTLDQYDALLAAQRHRCAICGTTDPGFTRHGTRANFHVDHDHVSGVVRGLLCFPCNKGLGMFKDNPEALMRAALYLRVDTKAKP